MLLALLACALLTSNECRLAQEAQATAWTVAGAVTTAEAAKRTAEARLKHGLAADADAAALDQPHATPDETPQLEVSRASYTRARVGGASLAEAAIAAENAELAVRARKVLTLTEAETRRSTMLVDRLEAWLSAERAWREAGGLYVLSRYLYASRAGEGVAPRMAPSQSTEALITPEVPIGTDPFEEELQGAQKAHMGRLAAETGVTERTKKLQTLEGHAAAMQAEVDRGATSDRELLSAGNEAKLVVTRARSTLVAFEDTAQRAAELDKDERLPLPPVITSQLEVARAATATANALCR